VGLVVPSIVWVCLDRSVWPWDPAWYGEVSTDLWATLRVSPRTWPDAMTHAFGLKPPAVAWLGQFFVPVGSALGRDSTALLLSVVSCQIASLALVYAALRRLGGDAVALVGGLVVAASPLFVSMSHEYFAEPIQTLAVAWLLFVLATAAQRRMALTLAQLPGVLALGMLAKLSSPAYLAAPALAAVLLAFLGRGRGPERRRPWQDVAVVASSIASAILVLGAISWYRINVHAAIRHARDATADNGLYGIDRGFVHQFPDWFARLRDAAFLPHLWIVLAVLATASLLLAARDRGRVALGDPRAVTAGACAASIVVVLASLASQSNQEMRYLLPLVPLLATLVALGVGSGGSRAIVGAALGVLMVEYVGVTLQSFGRADTSSLVSYPIASVDRDSRLGNALDALVAQTCAPATAGRINMVGGDYPWFNANTLEMLAAERQAEPGRRCYYTSLGYAERDPMVAWKRVQDFHPPFYISVDYGNPRNPLPSREASAASRVDIFNRVDRAIFTRVKSSPAFALVPDSRRDGFVVFRATNRS
jgi:Dolichyl-phosphate-mannose-protein mannosyltransferase